LSQKSDILPTDFPVVSWAPLKKLSLHSIMELDQMETESQQRARRKHAETESLDAAAAAVAADIDQALADSMSILHLRDAARACGCESFYEALLVSGLLSSFLDLSPTTLFAPHDLAFTTMPQHLLDDPLALRELLEAHIVIDSSADHGAESTDAAAWHSFTPPTLGGHRYALETAGTDGTVTRVGLARTLSAGVAFRGGVILPIDAVLVALVHRRSSRPEQVWMKHLKPPPELELIGFGGPGVLLEVRAHLVERASGQIVDDALRGDRLPVDCLHRTARFQDLHVEAKPTSRARKREVGASAVDANSFLLAFTLCTPRGLHPICSLTRTLPLELRNSFHSLSEAEKAARRVENAPRLRREPSNCNESSTGTEASPAHSAVSAPLAAEWRTLVERARCWLKGDGGQRSRLLASPPPVLYDISAASGGIDGGTTVWLHGAFFSPHTRVCFGEMYAPAVDCCSTQLLKCVAPPSVLPQTVRVTVSADPARSRMLAAAGGVHPGSSSPSLLFTYEGVTSNDW
jgi:uncharacterized surface protein with fasciclin (FAS1) repeats